MWMLRAPRSMSDQPVLLEKRGVRRCRYQRAAENGD
jgi:hypothetical protein